jgi:hypothetical protein
MKWLVRSRRVQKVHVPRALTTREPGAEGKCASEGGTTERHTYDEANRLTDEGVEYETFSDTTKLPASDSGGHELVSAYYVDGQVASQEQNKELHDYKYDPAGRTVETVSENKETKSKTTVISHYGSSSEVAWTSEGTEKWTRHIPGIDSALDAIQESGKSPVLQLHDLQGNIVGTAADGETETKLLSSYNSTEFGVPTTSSPPKYSWLGADGVASELTSTGVTTQNGSSYVPEIGRPLQTGPIASPGSFPNGTGGIGVVGGPGLGASVNQILEIYRQNEAARGEIEAREAYEHEGFCEKYRENPACNAAGPGGGNSGPAGGSPPLGAEGPLEGGCSGSNACSASSTSCHMKSLFGEPNAGELWLAAGVTCNRNVSGIQVEVCIMAWTGSGNNYAKFGGGCNGESRGESGEYTFGKSKGGGLITAACGEAWKYKGWAWAYAWGSNYKFESIPQISGEWTCAYAPDGATGEFLELAES